MTAAGSGRSAVPALMGVLLSVRPVRAASTTNLITSRPLVSSLPEGPRPEVCSSAHTADQARQAQVEAADYLGLGPMFATTTKPLEPQRGPELLDAVRPFLDRPSYAIGGLTPERIAALRPRLPHGVAVAGHLCRAAEPERAAAELVDLVGGAD